MKTIKFYMTLVIMAMVCVTTFSACGDDDDDDNNGTGATNFSKFSVDGQKYDFSAYGFFIDNGSDGGERTGSFLFSNINLSKGLSQNVPWTYISVRIPYNGTSIPEGSFTNNVDADFDINYKISEDTCELTGWSTNLTLTVKKSGTGYVVDIISNNFYTAKDYNSTGKKSTGSLLFHYEGSIQKLTNSIY